MKTQANHLWTLTAMTLATLALAGAFLAWSRYQRGSPLEIHLADLTQMQGSVYLGEGVVHPGTLPFSTEDTIGDLVRAAGGLTDGSNLEHLSLSFSRGPVGPQKVDINRAETWLLEALPGVGDTLAERIVDYRRQHGPFRNTIDLTQVSGLGRDTYDKIKDLITVGDS